MQTVQKMSIQYTQHFSVSYFLTIFEKFVNLPFQQVELEH